MQRERGQRTCSISEHAAAVVDEERVVMAFVRIRRVVGRAGRAVRHVLLGIDRPDRADVGLVAGGTRGALIKVHVQDAVAEDSNGVCVRRMTVFHHATPGRLFGDQHILRGVELVDALHRTYIDARTILYGNTRFGDDRDSSHAAPIPAASAT
jgi:hypothetical protein